MKKSGIEGATEDGLNVGPVGPALGATEGYLVGFVDEYEVTVTVPPQLFDA